MDEIDDGASRPGWRDPKPADPIGPGGSGVPYGSSHDTVKPITETIRQMSEAAGIGLPVNQRPADWVRQWRSISGNPRLIPKMDDIGKNGLEAELAKTRQFNSFPGLRNDYDSIEKMFSTLFGR